MGTYLRRTSSSPAMKLGDVTTVSGASDQFQITFNCYKGNQVCRVDGSYYAYSAVLDMFFN